MVARFHGMEEVRGSNPLSSTHTTAGRSDASMMIGPAELPKGGFDSQTGAKVSNLVFEDHVHRARTLAQHRPHSFRYIFFIVRVGVADHVRDVLTGDASAQYGAGNSISVADEYTTTDTESGEPELFTADQLLAAQFGLVFACAKRSYRGTIEPSEGGVARAPPRRHGRQRRDGSPAVSMVPRATTTSPGMPSDGPARRFVAGRRRGREGCAGAHRRS